jgi:hypothetical protein
MALGSLLASRLVRNATTSRVRLADVNSHRNSKLLDHSSSFIYLYLKLVMIPGSHANGASHLYNSLLCPFFLTRDVYETNRQHNLTTNSFTR